jgi:hypothetical protein
VLSLLDLVSIGRPTVVFAQQIPNIVTGIYCLTLATTVLATILIIVRILKLGLPQQASRYWNVIELVVESSALYSLSVIFVLPYWMVTSTDNLNFYPLEFVQTINATMIVSILPLKYCPG